MADIEELKQRLAKAAEIGDILDRRMWVVGYLRMRAAEEEAIATLNEILGETS